MNQPSLDTSSKWRFTAAAFALAAIAGFWSSPAALADDSDDDTADGPSAEAVQNARNPYISGPLTNVGGPNVGGGQQDPSGALGDILGDDAQGLGLDGVGNLLGGGGQGVNLDSVGNLLGGGGQGVNLDSVGNLLGGGGQGVNLDGVGQIVGNVLGNGGNGLSGIGSGSTANGDDSENQQVPEVVRKGVRVLNRALGDKGFNSHEPDSADEADEADDDN